MPVDAFQKLFSAWKPSSQLALDYLRLKTITLLALAAMLRPSDIAPKSGLKFTRKSVSSDREGGLIIYLHGIKNDQDHDGFRIVLRPIPENKKLCPVESLIVYMSRTTVQAGGIKGLVFVTLKRPYVAINANTVAKILNAAIQLAGLDPTQYSAKNFRPTGATMAITNGQNPEQICALG